MNTTVLKTEGLVKRFGGIAATQNVSLNVHHGARHALIGPNGAGKTTLINLLTGVLEPSAGRILLDGDDITTLAPHQRVRRGMVRTFQINQLFNSLTPQETLAMVVAQHLGLGGRWWQPLGRQPAVKERLLSQGAIPSGNTPQEFARLIDSEIAKWAAVVKASGARVD